MENLLADQIKKLGLGDYEALIYSILLQHSPSNAAFIAKKCDLSRSSVYTTLNSLIAKGLVATTYKNEVKQFIAQDHTALENLLKNEKKQLEEKFKVFETLSKSLQLFSRQNLGIPQIIFFEGQEGLKKIYLSMMREALDNSIMYILRDEFIWQAEWEFVFEEEWHNRVKHIKTEKNIQTKLLINSSKVERQKENTYKTKTSLEYRFLPKNNFVKEFAIYLMADTASCMSIEKNNLVGIKITNQHLVDNFKNIFEIMWQTSKK